MKLSLDYEVTVRQEGWNNRTVLDVSMKVGNTYIPCYTGISVEGFLETITDAAKESLIDIIAMSNSSDKNVPEILEVIPISDEELIATNMEKFKELFMKEAQEFAKHNEGFDAYEALDQVLDDDDIVNDIHKATIEEIPSVVEFAADHYIW